MSAITVTQGGTVRSPQLANLSSVRLTLDGTGQFSIAQIVSFTEGFMVLSESSYVFSMLSDISGTDIRVDSGLASLPGVVSYTHVPNVTSHIRAIGNTSVIELPNLQTITLPPGELQHLILEALEGGRLDLSGLTEIIDSPDQIVGGRRVSISSTGSESLIDLSSLRSFEDRSSASRHQFNNGVSVLNIFDGANINLGASTDLSNVEFTLDPTSALLGGNLILRDGSILTGLGNVVASVTNVSGTVIPSDSYVGLTIHGDYSQFEDGVLRAAINGTIDSVNYSRLIVKGEALLAGELLLTRAGNFVPDLFSDYPVLTANSVNGAFETITGNELDGEDIAAVYGSSVVALSRIFNRNPLTSFQYENTRGNQRSFLDVRQVNGARSSFRVYSPTGELIMLSNATPSKPNMGDVGVFELPDLGVYDVRVYSVIGTSPTFDASLKYAPLLAQPALYREIINGEITVPGATQVWEFDVKSGDEINLELQNLVGAGQQLSFTLRTPHGQAVLHRIANQSDFSDVVFPTHIATVDGTYTLTVDGVGDNVAEYQLVVSGSQAPFIRSHAARGPANLESINEAWFQFDQAMDVESFSLPEDLLRFRGPTGDLNATGFRWETPQTLVITFPDQPGNHELQMILAPSILSSIGLPLDQNNNRVPGEPVADQYAAILRLDRQGPFVIHTEPGAAGSVPLDRLTFHFNEPIDTATFSIADITAFNGPGGTDLRGQLTNFLVRGRSVTAYFETQTTPGAYSITIGPNIADLAGNLMDQSRDGVHGQANDSFTHNFELRSSNLRVVAVADPQPGTHPTELTFSWQVRNTGNEVATGSWWDYVYLSRDQTWDLDDVVAARVFYDTAAHGVLQPGETYTQTVTASMPGVLPGDYHVIVRSNILRTLAESTYSDNVLASSTDALLSLPSLISGEPQTSNVNHRDALYYRYDATAEEAGGSLLLRFGTSNVSVVNELYASFGTLPTPSRHDLRSQQGLASDQYLIIPNVRPGTYFIRAAVAPNSNSIAALGTATVTADIFSPGEFAILDSYFGQGGTAGVRTIEINGVNLDRSISVKLVGTNGTPVEPIRYYRPGQDKLYATFDLTTVEPGTYDVEFRNFADRLVTAGDAFEVVSGGGGNFSPNIVAPPAFRRGPNETWADRFEHLTRFPVTITWSNPGLNDVRFPLTVFNSNEPFVDPAEEPQAIEGIVQDPIRRNATTFVATDHGVPGLLMPGSSHAKTYRIILRPGNEAGGTPAYYGIDVLYDDPSLPFNWEGEQLGIDPRGLSEADFDAMFQQFADSIGPTNGDFLEMLSTMAFIVPHSSMDPFDAIQLFTQEAFDRYLAQRTASIVGQVQYDLFDIDFKSLKITATHSETFETFSASVQQDGHFTLPNILAGNYDLQLAGPAFTTANPSVDVLSGSPRNLTLPLLLGATISGTVLTADGTLISEARLQITAPALGFSRSITVQPDGSFAAEGLPPATYTLNTSAANFETTVTEISILPSQNLITNIALNTATFVSGNVRSNEDVAISGAEVFAVNVNTGQVVAGFSDASGNYSIEGLRSGRWQLTVFHPDFQEVATTALVSSVGHSESFILIRGATVFGRVLDSSGRPVAGAIVSIESESSSRLIITEEMGMFQLSGITDGPATIRVFKEGFLLEANEISPIPTLGSVNAGDIVISRSGEGEAGDGAGGRSEANDCDESDKNDSKDDYVRLQCKLKEVVDEFNRAILLPYPYPSGRLSEPAKPDCLCHSLKTFTTHAALIAKRLEILKKRKEIINKELPKAYQKVGFYATEAAIKIAKVEELLSKLKDEKDESEKVKIVAKAEKEIGSAKETVKKIAKEKAKVWKKVAELDKKMDEFEKKAKDYEDEYRAEKREADVPGRVSGSGIVVKGGAPSSFSMRDNPRVAKFLDYMFLKGNVIFRFEVAHNPPGSGVSISPGGNVTVGDGDCGSHSVVVRLVIDCIDPLNPGNIKTTKIQGTFTLNRLDRDVPRPPDPTCGQWNPAKGQDKCFKWVFTGSEDCGSFDPNDILGPVGFGDENWMQPTRRFDYTVRFENDPEEATAPAALVIVTQTLDPSFDFTTFRFGTYGFGDYVFSDAVGLPSHRSRIDLRSTIGIFVDVNASFDVETGEILFELESIDPQTGLIPFNPLMGFLPPNRVGSEGEGFFTYSVFPKAGLTTGTRIDAEAKIYFDTNDPIDTPPIFHTIDVTPPTSRMVDLPTQVVPNFVVSWLGEDIGSGPVRYDVYVSQDGAPFVRWLERTSLNQSPFPDAVIGSEYAFYSVVTDGVGYREAKPLVAETSTRVVADTANAPVLDDLLTGTYRGRSLVIDLLQQVGSSQSAIDPNSVVIVTDAEHGTVTMLGDGRLRYDANHGFVGEDEIAFTVRDVDGRVSNLAVVSIRVVGSPAQNPLNFSDVNDDGDVHPLDALMVLVRLAQAQRDGVTGGLLAAAVADELPQRFYDVDGNGRIEPLDALMVLIEIAKNNRRSNAEGESRPNKTPAMPSITVTPPSPRDNRIISERDSYLASLLLPTESAGDEAAKFASFDWKEDQWSVIAPAVAETRDKQPNDEGDERELADAVWGQQMLFW